MDAIRELNYRPGAVPAGGSAQAARTIGIFLWLGYSAPLTSNPYALTILDGILTTTLAGHWNATLISVQNWEDARSQVRLYADGRCDGFVLVAPRKSVAISEALRERHYPFVVIGSGINDPSVDSVNIDNVKAACHLTAHLIAQGHRRIAYLVGDEDMDDVVERVKGYRQALAAAGLLDDTWILRPGTYDFAMSKRRLSQFIDCFERLAPAERPTALMCANDQEAYNAWRILMQRGIQVPDDLSLAGFDDTQFSLMIDPPLTTLHQPLFELGKRGAEILLGRMDERLDDVQALAHHGSIKAVLDHHVVLRESVKNKAAPQQR